MGSIQTGHEVVVSPNRDRHTGANKVSQLFNFIPIFVKFVSFSLPGLSSISLVSSKFFFVLR